MKTINQLPVYVCQSNCPFLPFSKETMQMKMISCHPRLILQKKKCNHWMSFSYATTRKPCYTSKKGKKYYVLLSQSQSTIVQSCTRNFSQRTLLSISQLVWEQCHPALHLSKPCTHLVETSRYFRLSRLKKLVPDHTKPKLDEQGHQQFYCFATSFLSSK